MTTNTTTVNFADKEDASGLRDLLIITQEDWANNTGKVLMSDFYNFTYNALTSQTITNNVDCGLNANGSCTSTIYTYPRVSDLSYQLHTSFGSLSDRKVESYEHQELISFDIDNEADTEFTPSGNVSYSWIGSVYDSAGNVRSVPSVSIDSDGVIVLSSKVYGSLKLTYSVTRHIYKLTVTPRTYGSDLFGAVVYGVYENGISWHELQNPPDLDDLTEGSVSCGGLSVDDTDTDSDASDTDDDAPNTAPKVNRVITTDYCSQVVISDVTTYV